MSNVFGDVVELTSKLVRCPSITPEDHGALAVAQQALETMGFSCTRYPFEEKGTTAVDNLYARYGSKTPVLCFAGHTDVVPPGEESLWHSPPFAATVTDGKIIGRGTVDMKGGIAAFIAAMKEFLDGQEDLPGSVAVLLTGDEEGQAINGTRKVLAKLAAMGEKFDACLVGEPTSVFKVGDCIKIGRRGSLNCTLTVHGKQGHVAYPQSACNPIPVLVAMVQVLVSTPLDDGTKHFEPSRLAMTRLHVNNRATNVTPDHASAGFNIRFNDSYTAHSLKKWVEQQCATAFKKTKQDATYQLEFDLSGEAFITQPGAFVNVAATAVENCTGKKPTLSTNGGTSDARFIKDYTQVVELGLVNATMHQVNEQVSIQDLTTLKDIYLHLLQGYFHP